MSQNIRKRFCKSSHSVAKPCNNSLRFAKLSLIHQNISGSSCLHHKLSYKRASQGSTKRRNLLISKMFKGELSNYQILQYSYLSKKCGFQGLHYLIHPHVVRQWCQHLWTEFLQPKLATLHHNLHINKAPQQTTHLNDVVAQWYVMVALKLWKLPVIALWRHGKDARNHRTFTTVSNS